MKNSTRSEEHSCIRDYWWPNCKISLPGIIINVGLNLDLGAIFLMCCNTFYDIVVEYDC